MQKAPQKQAGNRETKQSAFCFDRLKTAIANFFALLLLLYCSLKFGAMLGSVFQSSDTAWLIKTGQFILKHGLPQSDPFSFTCAGKPIVIYQWLFTVALGALFQTGGLWLVGLSTGILLSCIFLWLMPCMMLRQGIRAVYVFGLLSLCVTPAWFWARPQLASFLFVAIFIIVLEHFRQSGKRSGLWLLPPLMLIWANTHSFWFIGIGILASYLVPDLLKNENSNKFESAAILICCCLAVFRNPYEAGLVAYNLGFMADSELGSITELKPLLITCSSECAGVLAYFLLCWTAIIAGRKAVPSSLIIPAAISTAAALSCYRFTPVAILLTWTPLGLSLRNFSIFREENGAAQKINSFASDLLPLFAVLGTALLFIEQFPPGQAVWFTHSSSNLSAVRFLKSHPGLAKRMFCDAAVGCSQILEDMEPVFIDTRFDFYGQDFCREYKSCLRAENGWQENFKKWRIQSACLEDASLLYKEMLLSPDWLLVYDNGTHSVWLPDNISNRLCRDSIASELKAKKSCSNDELEIAQMAEHFSIKHIHTARTLLKSGKIADALCETEKALCWNSKSAQAGALYTRLRNAAVKLPGEQSNKSGNHS